MYDLVGGALQLLGAIFRDEMHESFAEQLIDLWEGKTVQLREVVNYSLNGELINIHMQFAVLPGHEHEAQEFECDRELVAVEGNWVVRAL